MGFTFCVVQVPPAITVHPHTCGVYADDVQTTGLLIGSSPHMWGLPSGQQPLPRKLRFIPTHVGFTIHSTASQCQSAVHPHTCGVYCGVRHTDLHCRRFIPTHVGFTLMMSRQLVSSSGSSPHMWGLLSRISAPVRSSTVHPHTCGVYVWHCYFRNRDRGSSPHMWGLLMTREL